MIIEMQTKGGNLSMFSLCIALAEVLNQILKRLGMALKYLYYSEI